MKEISRSFSRFFLAAVLLAGVGCSKKPNDAQVSTDVQNKFSQDSGLSDKQLTVQASNGVVTLAGTVDNDAQRDAAARQAASIPGVREVVNNLQVGPRPRRLHHRQNPPPILRRINQRAGRAGNLVTLAIHGIRESSATTLP